MGKIQSLLDEMICSASTAEKATEKAAVEVMRIGRESVEIHFIDSARISAFQEAIEGAKGSMHEANSAIQAANVRVKIVCKATDTESNQISSAENDAKEVKSHRRIFRSPVQTLLDLEKLIQERKDYLVDAQKRTLTCQNRISEAYVKLQSAEENLSELDRDLQKAITINETGRQLPHIAANLVERKELEPALTAADQAVNRLVAIYGPSGTGKTQLALSMLQKLAPGDGDQNINLDNVAFIDCAQIGFDDVFVRCLQRLSKGEAVWNEIEDTYRILSTDSQSYGERLGYIEDWFSIRNCNNNSKSFILLDNCDRLFEGREDTPFLNILPLIIASRNTNLHLILTLKREGNVDEISGIDNKVTKIKLDVNLELPEILNYFTNCGTKYEEDFFTKLRGLNCATPLIVTLVCDAWRDHQEWNEDFFNKLECKAPIVGVLPEKSDETDEIRRNIAVGFLLEGRLKAMHTSAQELMVSLAVLALDKAGNQVAVFSKAKIQKIWKGVFPNATGNQARELDPKVCEQRGDSYVFRHEMLQKAVYNFGMSNFKESIPSLHSGAAQVFEELVVDPNSLDRIKWAMSAAYQWIEAGKLEKAENIIDSVDSSMRMQFLYQDYEKIRTYLREKLGTPNPNSISEKVRLENSADLGEIYYQGLDQWGIAEKMAREANGSIKLLANPVKPIPQSQIQARHLFKILIYEKQITEKVNVEAMGEFIKRRDIDKSIMANVYSTDGMHRTRAEKYDCAVKSYEEAVELAEQHCAAMITGVSNWKFIDPITLFLNERIYLWANLDIARYHSNKASSAAFTIGPKKAAADLTIEVEKIESQWKEQFPAQPKILIPSSQEFQYFTLNKVCLYLAAGETERARKAFGSSGEIPSENWLTQTRVMMQGILSLYPINFDTATNPLMDAERAFATEDLDDLRNSAFARFNRVTARINRLLSGGYNGDKQKEVNEILLELSNVRARPFWSVVTFRNALGFLQELKEPRNNKDLSDFVRQELLRICTEAENGSVNAQRLEKMLRENTPPPSKKIAASDLSWGLSKLFDKKELFGEMPCISPIKSQFRQDFLRCANHTSKLIDFCISADITGNLLEETRMRCCHDLLHEVYKEFIKQKDPADWLHEYAFAAKVVTYTSRHFAREAKKIRGIQVEKSLILAGRPKWGKWIQAIESYYGGLMGKNVAHWQAPFLMPRIVLLRSRPMLPSEEDVDTTCKWLEGIEGRLKEC